jgi:hypothetical protein
MEEQEKLKKSGYRILSDEEFKQHLVSLQAAGHVPSSLTFFFLIEV